MNYHIILTRRCNLNCHYCHGGEEQGSGTEIEYSIDDLASFFEKDDDIQLMLYGGEPTIRIHLISQLMDRFPNARFMLQTNALRLNDIPVEYVNRFHSILASIDGREMITDEYRSKGVYKQVIDNIRWLDKIGYAGDVVARMTVSQQSDIYQEVNHLMNLKNPSFDHIHWQLNAIWSAEDNWSNFDRWLAESYNPGITRLVEEWVMKLEDGVVGGIVPFLPLTYTLLTGQYSELRCGSGIDTFAIHVDGRIGVCPISPDWDFSIVGNILDTHPRELQRIMMVDEPCPSCEVFGICGGRCLFTNRERLWGEEGFQKICGTVKHLISTIKEYVPEIKRLIQRGLISVEDFNYPKFNNGCEVIP